MDAVSRVVSAAWAVRCRVGRRKRLRDVCGLPTRRYGAAPRKQQEGELALKERWYPIQMKQKCVPIWFTSVLSRPMTDQAGRREAGFARFLCFLRFEAVYSET